jgi:hypothetical protein
MRFFRYSELTILGEIWPGKKNDHKIAARKSTPVFLNLCSCDFELSSGPIRRPVNILDIIPRLQIRGKVSVAPNDKVMFFSRRHFCSGWTFCGMMITMRRG